MNAPATSIVKRCACGQTYTADQWDALPVKGYQAPVDGIGLEYRDCPDPCNSTLAIEIDEHGAPVKAGTPPALPEAAGAVLLGATGNGAQGEPATAWCVAHETPRGSPSLVEQLTEPAERVSVVRSGGPGADPVSPPPSGRHFSTGGGPA